MGVPKRIWGLPEVLSPRSAPLSRPYTPYQEESLQFKSSWGERVGSEWGHGGRPLCGDSVRHEDGTTGVTDLVMESRDNLCVDPMKRRPRKTLT